MSEIFSNAAPKTLHIPQRKCAGCGLKAPKAHFTRVFLDANGEICLDEKKILGGRGAYLCRNTQCVEKALKKRALERALKTKNPPGETLQNELRAALK